MCVPRQRQDGVDNAGRSCIAAGDTSYSITGNTKKTVYRAFWKDRGTAAARLKEKAGEATNDVSRKAKCATESGGVACLSTIENGATCTGTQRSG